jgi:hypothetical protein
MAAPIDIQRLELLGGEGDKPATLIFVAFDHLPAFDFCTGVRIERQKADTGRSRSVRRHAVATIFTDEARGGPIARLVVVIVLVRDLPRGLRVPDLM